MVFNDLEEINGDDFQLSEIIRQRKIREFRRWCEPKTPAELAEILESLENSEERLIFFRMLKTATASAVFTFLETSSQESLIKNFTSEELNFILDEIYTDEIADIIEEMPYAISKKIYRSIKNDEERRLINRLLKYDENQLGSIMAVNLIWLDQGMSCNQALARIRNLRHVSEIVSHFFVTDTKKRVVGAISFDELFFESDGERKIDELSCPVEILNTTQTLETAALAFAKHDLPVLPVVNSEEVLVGMLTADDVIDVIQEESTEDLYKSAGITDKTVDIPYSKVGIFSLVRSRIFWLIILMIGATLSQWIINNFQGHIIEARSDAIPPYLLTAIDSLIPVISGTAGNAGSQSATTITRALALGEINQRPTWAIKKEVLVGITIGTILALVNILRLLLFYLVGGQLLSANASRYLILILVSSITIFLVIVVSKFVAALVPLIAAKLKKDPAVMSAPILTTITDAVATLLFFTISLLLFINLV